MQTPIPPTKPIPPTPPNINSTSTATNGAETQNSPSTTPHPTSTPSVLETTKSSNSLQKQPQVSATKTPTTEKPASTSSTDTDQAPPAPYLGTYKDTSQNTAPAAVTPSANSKPTPSIGLTFFLPFVLIIALSVFALRWWKKTAAKKRTVLDYSKDNAKELLNLMNSQISTDSLPKPTPTLILKPKSKREAKGNFEIRI